MLALSRKMLKKPFLSRMITMLEPIPSYKKMWIEICTDNEEDWKTYLSLCCQALETSLWARMHLPDFEKRKIFLPRYLDYLYETEYSKGRASLVCIKGIKNEDCEPETFMAGAMLYKTDDISEGDKSRMKEIDQSGTDQMMMRGKWLEQHVHTPMRKFAKSFGAESWYLSYLVVENNFKKQLFGMKYSTLMSDMLRQDGLSRKQNTAIPFNYLIVTDVGKTLQEFFKKIGSIEIAHLHYNFKPELKCFEDPSANKGDQFGCVLVYLAKKIPMNQMTKLKSYL